ncbi:helix-turn-helix domain-containing protein [Corallococcus exiguus]|uniref:helix-turn-helix domain-containing protein n=1 Tax=Corallococcus exiguus TaxID=83462 RepID=UPI0014709841|nr:helix-turn-helix domain-containing protein [Corallococcus exiguus]NNB91895.1 helix-turn-helix domain-containing protein [Corallococcus exiguus]
MKKRALPQGRQQLRLRCPDRRRLIRWGERTGCPLTLRRCLAVAKVASGQSRAQAARQLLCATSTVVSAVQRFQKSGREGLLDRRAQNGQRKVDERFRQTLCRVLEGSNRPANDVSASLKASLGRARRAPRVPMG